MGVFDQRANDWTVLDRDDMGTVRTVTNSAYRDSWKPWSCYREFHQAWDRICYHA